MKIKQGFTSCSVFSFCVPREGLCLEVQPPVLSAKYMELLFFYQQNISHLPMSFSWEDPGLEHHFFDSVISLPQSQCVALSASERSLGGM